MPEAGSEVFDIVHEAAPSVTACQRSEAATGVPEIVPTGMKKSPYPDRIIAKPGFEKQLAKRTLTNLYNERPAWLDKLHRDLDVAVAAAYGWAWPLSDAEILRRLLALNQEWAGQPASAVSRPASRRRVVPA